MCFSTTRHPPLFEERNIFFFPTQHPHVALPFLTIAHWLSLSPSCHFHCFSESFSSLCHLSHCFITILNIPHCCSNCMVVIFVILSSFVITIPIIPSFVPTISYCSHHPITLPSSCCFKHPIVSLINPCCHPCCYSLFSFVMFAINIILVYFLHYSSQTRMSPNQNVPFPTKISTWTLIFNMFGMFSNIPRTSLGCFTKEEH
jgi:hypothetical protein